MPEATYRDWAVIEAARAFAKADDAANARQRPITEENRWVWASRADAHDNLMITIRQAYSREHEYAETAG